jgi:hypothetical protein
MYLAALYVASVLTALSAVLAARSALGCKPINTTPNDTPAKRLISLLIGVLSVGSYVVVLLHAWQTR